MDGGFRITPISTLTDLAENHGLRQFGLGYYCTTPTSGPGSGLKSDSAGHPMYEPFGIIFLSSDLSPHHSSVQATSKGKGNDK